MKNKKIITSLILLAVLVSSIYLIATKMSIDYERCGIVKEKMIVNELNKYRISDVPTFIVKYDDNFYDDVRVSYDTYYRYEKGDRVCFILEKNLLPAWVFVILCFAIIISFIWLILVIISIFDSKNVQP
jgi:hypothetical protein